MVSSSQEAGLACSFDVEQQKEQENKRPHRAFGAGLVAGGLVCAALLAIALFQQQDDKEGTTADRPRLAASAFASNWQGPTAFEAKQMAMKMSLNMMAADPKFQQDVEHGAKQIDELLANPQFFEQAKTVARRMKQVLADPHFKGQINLPVELRKAQVTQQHGVQSLLPMVPEMAFAIAGGAAGRSGTSGLRSPATQSSKRATVTEMNASTVDVSTVEVKLSRSEREEKAERDFKKNFPSSSSSYSSSSSRKPFDVKELAGVTAPLGFFDPVGFSTDETEGKIRFYREVELKHGRVGMLAALGFLVGENFHPLFGGGIDVPSYLAFQQTPLQTFWPAVVFIIAILEVFSVFTFESPLGGRPWTIRLDHEPGDVGFDPVGLKPKDPKELKDMQTKELNNGRLAMIAAAGMIAQELATGKKLF
jgi:hypothetical protein